MKRIIAAVRCLFLLVVDGEVVNVIPVSPGDAQENFVTSQGRTVWRQTTHRCQVCRILYNNVRYNLIQYNTMMQDTLH